MAIAALLMYINIRRATGAGEGLPGLQRLLPGN
jgi:hypothetical protein